MQYCKESAHKKTLSTVKGYLIFADRFLSDLYIDQINRQIMEEIITAKLATPVKPATVNRMMEVIRAILNKCVKEWEWLDKAPYVRMVQRYAHLAPEHLASYAGNISGLKGVVATLSATPGKMKA